MKLLQRDSDQSKRVRVAMTGLASVVVLIGLASAVFSTASKEPPVAAIGASKPDVVANMTDTPIENLIAEPDEPLAELGVAPGTASVDSNSVASSAPATQ